MIDCGEEVSLELVSLNGKEKFPAKPVSLERKKSAEIHTAMLDVDADTWLVQNT